MAVTVDEVRAFAATLPRSSEAFVRGRVKFRVGRIVFLSFSKDGTLMGFGFPKDWRIALVESEPEKFSMPSESDMRYSWVHARLDKIDATRCAISSKTPGRCVCPSESSMST